MSDKTPLIAVEQIGLRILWLRGERVMLDADLAEIYGVTTRQLNQQVKRNRERFPADFMFALSELETREVITNCDHLRHLKFSRVPPHAFTEHGAIMLASVLNSSQAITTSVQVVRAFVKLREMLSTHKELAGKLEELEKKYDAQFKVVFDAIRALMQPPKPAKKKGRIGFQAPPPPAAEPRPGSHARRK